MTTPNSSEFPNTSSAEAGDPVAGRCAVASGSVSVERYVSDYADAHLYEANAPKGLCDGCPHYRHATQLTDDDNDDWCWLKEGAFADGLWDECPAWIASQNGRDEPRRA